MDMIEDYFRDRRVIYSTYDGEKEYAVTAGVPQGSVLGPLLWNIMYDGVLRLALPERTTIVGFADDIAIVSVAKTVEDIEVKANAAVEMVGAWLSATGLALAAHKTEAVLISGRKIVEKIRITVGDTVIESKRAIKYLGVMIDDRLSFRTHVEFIGEKASVTQNALARIMPNIGGPKSVKRRIISSVLTSIMLYACPVWSEALSKSTVRRKLSSVYRLSAIRLICGFRTISDEAALVLAKTMPIDILADEMKRIYCRRLEALRRTADMDMKVVKREERWISMCRWQTRWENSLKGRWTFHLIPVIAPWIRGKHCESDYYMTQFLTGHGCFRKYLHRFGHDGSPTCPNCVDEDEDAEHALFRCPRFRWPREVNARPCQLLNEMLDSEDKWDECTQHIAEVIRELRRLERQRSLPIVV